MYLNIYFINNSNQLDSIQYLSYPGHSLVCVLRNTVVVSKRKISKRNEWEKYQSLCYCLVHPVSILTFDLSLKRKGLLMCSIMKKSERMNLCLKMFSLCLCPASGCSEPEVYRLLCFGLSGRPSWKNSTLLHLYDLYYYVVVVHKP